MSIPSIYEHQIRNSKFITKETADALMRGDSILLLGPSGSGKSSCVRELRDIMGEDIILTSTTGISAWNIDGCTVHRFTGLNAYDHPSDLYNIITSENWKSTKRAIRHLSVVVIDEISMLSGVQFGILDKLFRHATGESDKPFGGKQIIFTGDFMQLPPVSEKETPRGNIPDWCFLTDEWNTFNLTTIMLMKVYRQKDPAFQLLLDDLRYAMQTPKHLATIEPRLNAALPPDVDPIYIFGTNKNVEARNKEKLSMLPGRMHYYKMQCISTFAGNPQGTLEAAKAMFPWMYNIALRVGARVMILQNDPNGCYVNGSIGVLTECLSSCVHVQLDSGETVSVPMVIKEIKANGETLGEVKQIPIRLAYASTVHKVQGLTLENVIIDMSDFFQGGQFYVAISRCRTLEGLSIRGWNYNKVYCNKEALNHTIETMEKLIS